jgi:hypothetical protein
MVQNKSGANKITQATLVCFLTIFGEIFLKKSSKKSLKYFFKNSFYFIEVYVKVLVRNVIFKKNEIHL